MVGIVTLPWIETGDWALIEMLNQVAWRSTTGPGGNETGTALERLDSAFESCNNSSIVFPVHLSLCGHSFIQHFDVIS